MKTNAIYRSILTLTTAPNETDVKTEPKTLTATDVNSNR